MKRNALKMSQLTALLMVAASFLSFTATAQTESDVQEEAAPSAPTAQVIDLTLDGCVKMAIESATGVLKGQNDVEMSGIQVLQAYGQFLPSLTASAGLGATQGTYYNWFVTPVIVSERDWGANYQISTGVNIFNGFADSASLKSALEKKTSALYTLDWARQQIALDVAQTFLQAAFDQRLLAISRENLKVSQARLALLEGQARVGLKDLTDLLRQQALTSHDASAVSKVFASQKANMLTLLRKLRLDARKQYRIVEPQIAKLASGDESGMSEDKMLSLALRNRLDLKASEYALASARHDVEVAHSGNLPKVDFSLSAADVARNLQEHNVSGANLIPADQHSVGQQLGSQLMYNVGFTVTWNIFDRDLTKANEARARIATKNRQIDMEDVRNGIAIDVRRAYVDFVSAKDQLKANETGRVAAEKAFLAIKGKYEVGASKFIDLADAQASLVQAQSAEAQSIYQVELQRRVLLTVTGQ